MLTQANPETSSAQAAQALTGLSLTPAQMGATPGTTLNSQSSQQNRMQSETRETIGSTLANAIRERTPARQPTRQTGGHGPDDGDGTDIIAEARRALSNTAQSPRVSLAPVKPGYIAGDTKMGKFLFRIQTLWGATQRHG